MQVKWLLSRVSIIKSTGLYTSTYRVWNTYPSQKTLLDETPKFNPVSLYIQTNIQSEGILLELVGESFAPTIFWIATSHCKGAQTEFVVSIFAGDQYCSYFHVRDAARAHAACLNAPLNLVKGGIFISGQTRENIRSASASLNCRPTDSVKRMTSEVSSWFLQN